MKCLHCGKKVGWLKKPVDGLYCGVRCRDGAQEEALRRRHAEDLAREASLAAFEAEHRAIERERLEIEAATLRGKSEIVLKPNLAHTPCPKCGSDWDRRPGRGALGHDMGECRHCAYRADFISIETCPNCRCQSLVVESLDDARCPRCKSRPRRRRQIA
jgi:hypothetical protein